MFRIGICDDSQNNRSLFIKITEKIRYICSFHIVSYEGMQGIGCIEI